MVDESAAQLRDAVAEMQRNINRMASEAGVIHGVVENISRSIALTDEATLQSSTVGASNAHHLKKIFKKIFYLFFHIVFVFGY